MVAGTGNFSFEYLNSLRANEGVISNCVLTVMLPFTDMTAVSLCSYAVCNVADLDEAVAWQTSKNKPGGSRVSVESCLVFTTGLKASTVQNYSSAPLSLAESPFTNTYRRCLCLDSDCWCPLSILAVLIKLSMGSTFLMCLMR
jgi:hypothetical protein